MKNTNLALKIAQTCLAHVRHRHVMAATGLAVSLLIGTAMRDYSLPETVVHLTNVQVIDAHSEVTKTLNGREVSYPVQTDHGKMNARNRYVFSELQSGGHFDLIVRQREGVLIRSRTINSATPTPTQ